MDATWINITHNIFLSSSLTVITQSWLSIGFVPQDPIIIILSVFRNTGSFGYSVSLLGGCCFQPVPFPTNQSRRRHDSYQQPQPHSYYDSNNNKLHNPNHDDDDEDETGDGSVVLVVHDVFHVPWVYRGILLLLVIGGLTTTDDTQNHQ